MRSVLIFLDVSDSGVCVCVLGGCSNHVGDLLLCVLALPVALAMVNRIKERLDILKKKKSRFDWTYFCMPSNLLQREQRAFK